MTIKGRCLCGACEFTISGDPGPINKCHCTKCRKVSGTGSNAVLWIEPENLSWQRGEDTRRIHTRPDGWQSVFCSECGSPLPRLIAEEEWIVPAGLLDEDPDTEVLQHIWVQEKPSWEVIGDPAPQYDQYPVDDG